MMHDFTFRQLHNYSCRLHCLSHNCCQCDVMVIRLRFKRETAEEPLLVFAFLHAFTVA